jgi:hypothetical protein
MIVALFWPDLSLRKGSYYFCHFSSSSTNQNSHDRRIGSAIAVSQVLLKVIALAIGWG